MPNDRSNYGEKKSQDTPSPKKSLNVTRLAWRVVFLWGACLLIAAVGSLAVHWLSVRPNVTPPAAAEESAGQQGQQNVPVLSVKAMEAAQAAMEREADLRPRTVNEMLMEAGGDTSLLPYPLPAPSGNFSPDAEENRQVEIAPLPDRHESNMSDELTTLLKEARYAQIEGDMRKSVTKLEQAQELAPDNPAVSYYFGLAYEFLRNGPKSREYFSKVVTRREEAGKYYDLASLHLERGFSSPADTRGDIAFGTVLEYKEPDTGQGEKVILTIPIMMKDGLNIRPEDLYIPIHFFDSVNGKNIDLTRAQDPAIKWISEPVDWAAGEEILEVQYYMPPLTQEELTAYGDIKYYGYTAKLYYKGEPMDCRSSPPVLFLIEQMKLNKSSSIPGYYDNDNLLPPLDAVPMSDDMQPQPVYVEPGSDKELLPP